MAGGDPMGDQLSGEVEVASFHGGELRLTNLRLRYRGHGRRRGESFEMQLSSLTGVGIVRRHTVHMWILLFPLVLLALGFVAMVTIGQEGPFVLGFLLAVVGTPILVIGSWSLAPVYGIRVVGGGYAWTVSVPRRSLGEARAFTREVSAAIATGHESEPARVEAPAYTARPFVR